MELKDWTVLMDALRIISPALGGWAVYLLRQVLTKLSNLDKRLSAVEKWNENHEEMDDLRFTNAQRQLDKLAK